MPPVSPNPSDTLPTDEAFDQAMHALARAGIAFEVVPDVSLLERAA